MRRARNEIIKRNATDYVFPICRKRIGMKYGSEEGVQYSIEDIEYCTRAEKKLQKENFVLKYGGMICIKLMCYQLSESS